MGRLGISIYPERSVPERDREYIRLAGKYGFKRIFSCLLSVGDKKKEALAEEFKGLSLEAHKAGMEMILDVSPEVFKRLGASYEELGIFEELGADGIRLDEGFDGLKECAMSYNPYGLKIELNASGDAAYVANVMEHHPKPGMILTCHNFYPQRYTGISLEHFRECNRRVKEYGLPVAAFVSSGVKDSFGPWPVNEGLCTLESHRGIPMGAQVRHLLAEESVDDIIIANAYASEEELAVCAAAQPGVLTFGFAAERELARAEELILNFDQGHVIRGDLSEYLVRSTRTREVYKDWPVPPANTRDMRRGDVVIVNDGYARYKGELQVILKDMPNDGRRNVIGRVPEWELVLLDYIRPWKRFAFAAADEA